MLPEPLLASLLDITVWGADYGERLAKQYTRRVVRLSITMRIQLAAGTARRANDLESYLWGMEGLAGSSVAAHGSISAATGLLLYCKGEFREIVHVCANIGDDTNSIAAIVGTITGAWRGFDALPEDKHVFFRAANNKDFDIEAIASGLTLFALQA